MAEPLASVPGGATPPKKKLSREERDEVISLSREGLEVATIAREKNFYGKTVSGIVSSARKRGELPPGPGGVTPFPKPSFAHMQQPQAAQPQFQPQLQLQPQAQPQPENYEAAPLFSENPPMTAPVPQASMQPASPVPPGPTDDFTNGRSVMGGSGGFISPQSQVRYTVERVVPQDGLLGTHHGSFSQEELGQIYGAGTYNITKRDPNMRTEIVYQQKVSDAYGPAKFPNNGAPAAATQAQQRPGMPHVAPFRPSYARPWDPQAQQGASPDEMGAAPRPFPRPMDPDRLSDFSRHRDSQDATRAAMEVMDKMHQRSIESMEAARKSGPDTFMTRVLEAQTDSLTRRLDEERKQEAARRDAEETRADRRQKEEQARWDARQKEEGLKHDREIQRIREEADAKLKIERQQGEERERRDKADRDERERRAAEERKFLLDLEAAKLNLIKTEADAAQKRLEAELARAREESRNIQQAAAKELQDTREATAQHIAEAQASLKEQLEREREALEQMHKLKEKHFEKEAALEREMLQMQKENLDKQSGNEVFNTVNTIIKEGSKAVEKFVDLQKYQSMTNMAPEAQIAAASRGALDGTGLPIGGQGQGQQTQQPPGGQQPPPQQIQPQSQPQVQQQPARMVQAAQAPAGSGNGHAAAQPAASDLPSFVESKMEGIIRAQLKSQIAQEILNEWSVHVDSESDATAFANMFLEMMRDETNMEARKACAAFVTFIKPRKWAQVYKVIRPEISEELQAIFDKPHAAGFYEQFRTMIVYQVHDYWVNFMQQAQQAQTAQQVPPMPSAPPAPAQQGAEGQSLPAREALRQVN